MNATMPPSMGLWRDEKHRYYWCGDGPLTSVTTAMKALDKPALVGWAKRETAACAVRNLDWITEMVRTGGADAAVAWLKAIPDYARTKAADLGTRVHILAETMSAGDTPEMTEEEAPFVAQYRSFLDLYQPEFLRVEAKVCNLTHRYAGTLDSIAIIDDSIYLIDVKTGTGIYPETALQLAGLGYAEFLGWPGDPNQYAIPPIDHYAVLHLRPDSFQLVPYDVTSDTFDQFIRTLRLYEWMRGAATKVMGQPVPIPYMEAA